MNIYRIVKGITNLLIFTPLDNLIADQSAIYQSQRKWFLGYFITCEIAEGVKYVNL